MSTQEQKVGVVYIGNKPTINYVMAAVLQINQGMDKVVLKARGRAISKAVDVAEITRQKYLIDVLEVSDIRIGTEEIIEEDGTKRDVSVIEIELSRKKPSE